MRTIWTADLVNAFYREFDETARDSDLWTDTLRAEFSARRAVDMGENVTDDVDDCVRVCARVAFRYASQALNARDRRMTFGRRPRTRGMGADTWEEYHGKH